MTRSLLWAISRKSGESRRFISHGPVALRAQTLKLTRGVRLLLAVVALAAVLADPSQPIRYHTGTFLLLGGYLAFALALFLCSLLGRGLEHRSAIVVHLVDLAILSALNYTTEGSTSPFFLLLTFVLLNATLRWRWRGAVLSGTVLLCVFLVLVAVGATEPERERLIIRSGFLVSLTLMLAVMGHYQERLSNELARLAAPAFPPTTDVDTALGAVLHHAAQVFQAQRAIAAWSEGEEPWLHILAWSKGGTSRAREAPDEYEPLVAEVLSNSTFFSPGPGSHDRTLVYQAGTGYREWRGEPINAVFRERFGLTSALSVPLEAERVEGRIFIAAEHEADPEDLLLLNIVARQGAAHVAQVVTSERLRKRSAVGERLRIARDLHDGILQFLTGIGLQLESISRDRQNPVESRRRLADIQALIRSQQQEVRGFVQTLKPILADRHLARSVLRSRLDELTRQLVQAWHVEIDWTVEPRELQLPIRLEDEIAHRVSEAVANAARHGGAKRVAVKLQRDDGRLRLQIADDGSGFQFTGPRSAAERADRKSEPVMLRERVLGLGGLMEIDSSPAGVTIDIFLPVEGQ